MKQFRFKEISISIDDIDVNELSDIDKLVVIFDNEGQLKKWESIYPELIIKKIYPLTKGIPFCKAKIEHCIELFFGEGHGKKKSICKSCKLFKYCNYNSEDFEVSPIKSVSDDLILFLEERDESLNDWI